MSKDKKFSFKKGAGVDVEAVLAELIDKKLAALKEKDEDFETFELEEEEKPQVQATTKAPKLSTKRPKLKLEERRLLIDDEEERKEFDAFLLSFRDTRNIYNKLDKEIKEGREIILEKVGVNLVYEGDSVALKIGEAPQSSVNVETVINALVDLESEDMKELKAGIQQILDLARLGILSIGKTDFERWIKAQGHEVGPFLVQRSPKKIIRVTTK